MTFFNEANFHHRPSCHNLLISIILLTVDIILICQPCCLSIHHRLPFLRLLLPRIRPLCCNPLRLHVCLLRRNPLRLRGRIHLRLSPLRCLHIYSRSKKKLPNQMKIGQQMTYSTSQRVDKRYVAMLWLCEFYPAGHTDNIVK